MAKLLTSILIVIVVMGVFVPDTEAGECIIGSAKCTANGLYHRTRSGDLVACCPRDQRVEYLFRTASETHCACTGTEAGECIIGSAKCTANGLYHRTRSGDLVACCPRDQRVEYLYQTAPEIRCSCTEPFESHTEENNPTERGITPAKS